ncbi:MAG: SIR2 family protein [Pseudomonadota bacterium]
MSIKDSLIKHLKEAPSAPFLFLGSGFSRRYIGLPQWSELLRKFATDPDQFEYFLSSAAQDLPKVASLLAENFHDRWWKNKEYFQNRKLFATQMVDRTSALRLEICQYISGLTNPDQEVLLPLEVDALKDLNIEGVITTNWDGFIETLYPDYKVFIGQDELLFSNPQSIGEIYKIHGCASQHNSLILTSEDYSNFNKKNPYLAAKLITLFVEHPIVFIGYSIADPNVRGLLRAIASVLSQDKLDKLSKNLIFVQRANSGAASYSTGIISLEDGDLPITIVTSNDYLPVYEAIHAVKRKMPARILRYCKEQLYELVRQTDPSQKMFVVDANNIADKNDVEFVVGVGVAAERAGRLGYKGISAFNLFEDLLLENHQFDAGCILSDSVPLLGRGTKFIPIFKYLSHFNINSQKAYKESKWNLDKHLPLTLDHYQTPSYKKAFDKNAKGMNVVDIIKKFDIKTAAVYIPFVSKKDFDSLVVQSFLESNIKLFQTSKSGISTSLRKLACVYDYHVYGWDMQKKK